MRVLLAVLVNLVLVTALTIASVHIQLSPLLNRLEWANWVHMALMLVCLAQFTMAAVWAATARGRRLGLWAHGMLLVMACTVPLFIALTGGISGDRILGTNFRIPSWNPFLVFETHCVIAIGWSGLFLVSLFAARRITRRRSSEPELPVDTPTGKGPQSPLASVCSLIALGLIIGYGREFLPMVDHLPYIRDPGPSLRWWQQFSRVPFVVGVVLVPLACLAVVSLMPITKAGPSLASMMFPSAKREENTSPEPSGEQSVVRHFRNPGVAILTVVSIFFFVCHATGTIDHFKLRVLTHRVVRLFANDRTLTSLEQQTTLKRLNLTGLTISDSGLTHLRGFKDLEILEINPFGPGGQWLSSHESESQEFIREVSPRESGSEGEIWIEGVLGSDVSSPITDSGLENFKGLTKLKELDLSGLDISDKGLMFFARNTNLERLSLNHTRVAGTAFRSLSLKRLRELDLNYSQMNDTGLVHLKGLTALETLNLYGTKITGTGFSHLKELANLQSLWAANTKFTDMGLVHLAGFTNLQKLSLQRTPITDVGLAHLKGLTKLQELDLSETQITDAGLLHVKGLINLQTLTLYGTQITDEGMVHLKGLANLYRLYLNDTKVTDAGLVYLKDITKLGEVHLLGTNVTEEGVGELRKSRPGCMVVWFPR
jgi:Leucine-rich repeat (LRR) protein